MGKIKIGFMAVFLVFALHCTAFESAVRCKEKARDCLVAKYTSQIGVVEATGNNDGKQVESYLLTCNLGPGYAWCAAFVNWCHVECGIETNISGAAWSPNWFPDNSTVYIRGKPDNSYRPLSGDVFGIYYSSKNRIAHVGFVHLWDSEFVITVEGNTNNDGSREGNGVYKKRRLTKTIYKVSSFVNT